MFTRFFPTLAIAAALGSVLVGGASAVSASPSLPPGWSHVQINVTVKGTPETLVYDRGRITAVSATSITLRERDGSSWVIGVAPTTQITINGQPAAISQVQRQENATTVTVNGGPATKVTVTIPPGLAAQQARLQQAAAARAARQAAQAAARAARQAKTTTQQTTTTQGTTTG